MGNDVFDYVLFRAAFILIQDTPQILTTAKLFETGFPKRTGRKIVENNSKSVKTFLKFRDIF